MSIVSMNVSFESESLLKQIGEDEVRSWLERQGYACMKSDEASKYINIEKSIGTLPFYKLLVESIESGKLSLEMLIGHITTRKLMQKAEDVAKKLV